FQKNYFKTKGWTYIYIQVVFFRVDLRTQIK
ncbi:hypothetical protein M5D96_013943, partial [Drosophila gunungcola]